MSVKVPINTLTDDQRHYIIKKVIFHKTDAFTGHTQTITPYHIDQQGEFIYLPISWAVQNGYKPEQRSTYKPLTAPFQGSLREYQKQVKSQVIKQLNQQHTSVCALHVGWGKTIFAIYIACKLKMKTMIVVNRLVLMDQWAKSVREMCPEARVFVLKPSCKKIDLDADFVLVNAMNLSKLHEKFPDYLQECGLVVVDELHLICAKHVYKGLYYLTPRYLLGLSATPYRTDGMDPVISFYFGEERIHKDLERQHLVLSYFTNISLDYSYKSDGRIEWSSVLEAQAQNEERNELIVSLICLFSTRNFLVLVKRIEHGKVLEQRLQERGVSCTNLFGNKTEFDKEARVLIATQSKVGTGFSHNRLDALLLAADMESYFIQYAGRVFRTETVTPVIIDLIDKDPGNLTKHYRTREKVYKSVGGEIHKVTSLEQVHHILKN